MKIVRRITYEVPDTPEGKARLKQQMLLSIGVGGPYHWLTDVTIEQLEGPQWETDGERYRNSVKGEVDVQ